jgi:hypothetical protein
MDTFRAWALNIGTHIIIRTHASINIDEAKKTKRTCETNLLIILHIILQNHSQYVISPPSYVIDGVKHIKWVFTYKTSST